MPDDWRAVDRTEEFDDAADRELHERVMALVQKLAAAENEEDTAATETELGELGDDAADRMIFVMTDHRHGLSACRRVGTALGRIGDPRLSAAAGGAPFVDVGAGSFVMGGEPLEPEAATHALPQHEVELPSFAIGRYPVTNQAFAPFVEDGGYTRSDLWLDEGWAWREKSGATAPHYWKSAARRPNHPVVGVCWWEAQAYCRWLTERMTESGELRPGERVRLPSEAEWEKAARGGGHLDRRRSRPNPMPRRRFPWGDAFFANLCNTAESGIGATTPVGMFPAGASPYNIDDVTGNVLEWCSSKPSPYPYHASDGREFVEGGRTPRVARGGAWPLNGDAGRCAYRHWNRPDFRAGMIGVRVVRGHTLD